MVENNRQTNSQEASVQVPPTNLDLFRVGLKNESFQEYSINASNFARDLRIAAQVIDKLQNNYSSKAGRLKEITNEKDNLMLQHQSQITASLAYLKIHEDLSARNIPEDEINSFFFKCFAVNCRSSYLLEGPDKNIQYMQMLADSQGDNSRLSMYGRKVMGKPPKWFNSPGGVISEFGNRQVALSSNQAWESFAFNYGSFRKLLTGLATNKMFPIVDKTPGFTTTEYVPDWFENAFAGEPVIDLIHQEIGEDVEEQNGLVDYLQKLSDRETKLASFYSEKQMKTILRIETKRRELIRPFSNLAEIVTFLAATEGSLAVEGEIEEIRSLDYPTFMSRIVKDYNITFETYIQGINEGFPFIQSFMALWIESKFKEANILSTDKITPDLVEKLNLAEESKVEELRELKNADKKVFALINYELKPLISAASDSDKEYLHEIINASVGESVGFLINELAYIAINGLRNDDRESSTKKYNEIKKFATNWIRRNWRWAFETLKEGKEFAHQSDESSEDDSGQEIIENDIQEIIDDSEKSIFQDWNIFYTANMRVQNNAELITIVGEDVKEIEESLDKILLREGDQVSIKTRSVVNAIEWVLALPDDIYDKKPEKIVNGEAFKKIKRGAVRILLQRDSKNKNITFYLHQKKAFTYGY